MKYYFPRYFDKIHEQLKKGRFGRNGVVHLPLIPALGRQRQADLRGKGQPELHSETLSLKTKRKRNMEGGREGGRGARQ